MKKENEMLLILEAVFRKLVSDYPWKKTFTVYMSNFIKDKLITSLSEHKIWKGVNLTDQALIFTWRTKTKDGKNTEVVISLDSVYYKGDCFEVFEEVMYGLLQDTRSELNAMLSKKPIVVVDDMTSALMRTDLTGMFDENSLPLYNEEDLV